MSAGKKTSGVNNNIRHTPLPYYNRKNSSKRWRRIRIEKTAKSLKLTAAATRRWMLLLLVIVNDAVRVPRRLQVLFFVFLFIFCLLRDCWLAVATWARSRPLWGLSERKDLDRDFGGKVAFSLVKWLPTTTTTETTTIVAGGFSHQTVNEKNKNQRLMRRQKVIKRSEKYV